MDCYKILGIEQDADKRTIKRAYALLIKVHTPDQHPDEFQRIKNAYDHALTLLEATDQNDSNIAVDDLPLKQESVSEIEIELEDYLQQFDATIEHLFAEDDYQQWNASQWQSLLDHPALHNLKLKQQLRDLVFQRVDYLLARNYIRVSYPFNLPEAFVTDLAQCFDWKDYEESESGALSDLLELYYYPDARVHEFVPQPDDHISYRKHYEANQDTPDLMQALKICFYLSIFIFLLYKAVTSQSYLPLAIFVGLSLFSLFGNYRRTGRLGIW